MPYKDKEKQREYMRNWTAKRRSDYLENKYCVVCGSIDDLEIDHIEAEKKISHRVWSWTEARRTEELKKCQVLCIEHHKQKSKADAMLRRKHGRTMYAHGCKCEICVDAQRQHNAQRYAAIV